MSDCYGACSCNDCCRDSDVLKGLPGDNGSDGLSVMTGVGAPSNTLGSQYTIYVDKNSPFNVYFRASNGVDWNLHGQLKGIDGNGFLLQSTVALTSSMVLNLYGTPKLLVANPPTGYALSLIEAIGSTGAGSGYSGMSQVTIRYTDGLTAAAGFTATFGSVPSIVQKVIPNAITNLPKEKGLELYQPGANPTGGNFGITIYLTYRLWLIQ